MECAELIKYNEQNQSNSLLRQQSENSYQFTLNGITGKTVIHKGSNLSQEALKHVQEGRRTYRMWSLPEFEDDILKLDAHDLSQNGWLSWHVLTEYGGKTHTVSAYMPDLTSKFRRAIPLEFAIWHIQNAKTGQTRSLWEAFSKIVQDSKQNPESSYLIFHRLAISQKETLRSAPFAAQICFATSQIALEHYLRDKPFRWVVSQQRHDLSKHLKVYNSSPLFIPAEDMIELKDYESLLFDPTHKTLRILRNRYPGYWYDHETLGQKLSEYMHREEFNSVFRSLWSEMKRDGIHLKKGRELNQLIRPRNLKYLSLAFSESPELFNRCNKDALPGPFCSITKRHAWFASCSNILDSAQLG